ncbi:acetylase, partial [Burkholderia pseudomallei]
TGLRKARLPRRHALTQARAYRLLLTSVDPDLVSPDMAAAYLPPRGAHRATKARFASRATCASPHGTHGAATRVTAALPSS